MIQHSTERKGFIEKEESLFCHDYEAFYEMAEKSAAFHTFCKDAFGQAFSQDGFSDTRQIDMILPDISAKEAFDMLMMQTKWSEKTYPQFEKAMARYIYTAKK